MEGDILKLRFYKGAGEVLVGYAVFYLDHAWVLILEGTVAPRQWWSIGSDLKQTVCNTTGENPLEVNYRCWSIGEVYPTEINRYTPFVAREFQQVVLFEEKKKKGIIKVRKHESKNSQ